MIFSDFEAEKTIIFFTKIRNLIFLTENYKQFFKIESLFY